MTDISKTGGDVEAGKNEGQLYPNMTEDPKMRWALIRKVYVILTLQMLLTIAVACAVVFIRPIPNFMLRTVPGIVLYVLLIISTLILLWPLHKYMQRHPVNLVLLVVFTILVAFSVGLSCSFRHGKVVLEAGILTAVVTISLTLYTFWAAKRGRDFSFLGPFLFAALLVLVFFSLVQIFFPPGKLGRTIFGCIGAIIFSGFIVYDTDNLIKRFNYDEYVAAAVCLYLDIINLFGAMLGILGTGE